MAVDQWVAAGSECRLAPEGRTVQAYNQEAFHYFLALERTRAERSNRRLLLVLVSGTLADRLSELWGGGIAWEQDQREHPHEAHYLRLDSSKARERLGWAPRWDLDQALTSIAAWHAGLAAGEDARALVLKQVEAFEDSSHPSLSS